MAWPTTTIDTTQMDIGTDDPSQARIQIKQMADNVNAIKDAKGVANGVAPLDASSLLPVANLPTVPANKGGTGQTVFAVGDILYAGTTSSLSKLSPGTSGYVLKSNGPGAAPSWGAQSLSGPITGSGLTQATARLLGRTTAGTGAIEELTVGSGLTLSGGVLDTASQSGYTLLGTLTTTSGTTQTLSGLDLTTYKFLKIFINGVSHAIGGGGNLLLGGKIISAASTSAAANLCGEVEIDLTTGILSGSTVLTNVPASYAAGDITTYTSSSTSIAFAWSGGTAFDLGSIKVYGLK